MLLKNFLRGIFQNDLQTETGGWQTMGGSIANDWNTWRYTRVTSKADAASWQSRALALGVGSGDTDPTYDDIALANDVTSSLTFLSGSAGNNITGSGIFYTISVSYQNNTQSAITIKELGIVSVSCYFTRAILDSPVTINPGEIYNFSYTISIL